MTPIDLPQNPQDLEAEYAIARTDRTHVLTFNYVYELPFFREGNAIAKAVLGGWQVAGITQMWSGPPISRVVNGSTNGSRRGIRVNELSDPLENLPADVPGGVYWFNPAAFAAPADGSYGDTGRAIFRLPGVHQWDLTLSKNFYAPEGVARAVPRRLHQRVQPHAVRPGDHSERLHRRRGSDLHDRRKFRSAHGHPRPTRDPARFATLVALGPA